ncbi:hypothetical protein D9619_012132 [Psilocybe cf. subviscida]|uniref:Uncharacterized protein n=1 Tax=Psilocybe cf. subviscida TaxID=2480587 RepID=A0A8H5EZV4_9AGAR|nr:hypothetical protein D9619_012132 [Psilocybe cf. subviscida]
MSALNPGKYVIRFIPLKGEVGGGVATCQNQPDQPVKVDALSPDLAQSQTWAAMPGEVEGQWGIASWNDGSVYGGLLTIMDPTGVPAGPVITASPPDAPGPSDKDQYWIVTPVDVAGETDTFTLRPVTKAVGMDYYVGVKDGEMYIQDFAVGDDKPKPYWQFINTM